MSPGYPKYLLQTSTAFLKPRASWGKAILHSSSSLTASEPELAPWARSPHGPAGDEVPGFPALPSVPLPWSPPSPRSLSPSCPGRLLTVCLRVCCSLSLPALPVQGRWLPGTLLRSVPLVLQALGPPRTPLLLSSTVPGFNIFSTPLVFSLVLEQDNKCGRMAADLSTNVPPRGQPGVQDAVPTRAPDI